MLAVVTKCLLIALFSYRCLAAKVDDRFYPRFHLSPPHGWMNDPNGFCDFQDSYHVFYQYNPVTSQEPGIAHWGHAKSSDLMSWENLPIAMYPDESYDRTGVFSGGAIIVNETMYAIYTANRHNPGETPDNEQRQALATSTDGVKFTKFAGNPIIKADEHQPDIRDPKVWEHDGVYYMVLGNTYDSGTRGRILLYSSEDLISWKEVSTLHESDGSLGYMWECPDFFELCGHYVLMFSPQGIDAQGDDFKNLFQVIYVVGTFDYESLTFTVKTEPKEVDHGHDFYATQSMIDKYHRRVLIAWGNMWERVYPERNDGWAGQLTIPRVLSLSEDLSLIQKPVTEISVARGQTLYSGRAQGGDIVQLEDKTGEIKITASKWQNLTLFIESTIARVSISYDSLNGKVTLDRGGEDGIRRTNWRPATTKLEWYILVDASSIELFCGDGELTFTSRYFPYDDVQLRFGDDVEVENLSVSAMKRTVEMPNDS